MMQDFKNSAPSTFFAVRFLRGSTTIWHNETGSLLVQKAGLAMATAVLILGLAVMFSTRGGEIGQSLVQVFTCQLGRFGGGGAGCGAPAATTPGGGGGSGGGAPTAPQANSGGGGWLDGLQTALDVIGLVPVIGEPVDLVNGVIYAARGDWVNAGLSFTAMIPIGGQAATGSKLVLKYGDEAVAVVRNGDNAADAARTGRRAPCFGSGVPLLPVAAVGLPMLHGVLAAGSGPCDINGNPISSVGNNNQQTVYRVIRPDEDPTQGLRAKNPNATYTPEGHVLNGSRENFQSQYISTTTDIEVARRWAAQSGNRIVEIDIRQINGTLLDLATDAGRASHLRGRTARNFARSSSEVLVVGDIPPGAIRVIQP